MNPSSHLEIVPLGGLGEFGMNLMVYRCEETSLIVDAGMMFPGSEHHGVDVVIPDLSALDECGALAGLVLTHGHEDHIGAVPYLLARHDVPVYATPHVEQLLRRRFAEHPQLGRPTVQRLPEPGERLEVGPFEIETLAMPHSLPMTRSLALRTPVGLVVHTGDFKLAASPDEPVQADLGRLSELGREGVRCLLIDSTNADRPGFTPGEQTVTEGIDALLAGAPRRVVVTTFSSNVYRIASLARLARRHGRRIALVGASIENHMEVAQSLGLVSIDPAVKVAADRAMELPADELLLVVTGSQGEPQSALARIAVDKHRDIHLDEGDLVIHSARVIPGNEKSIGRMFDHLARRGARVVARADAPVHVSGHASADELRQVLQILQPQTVIPIHGEYRQLVAARDLAIESGIDRARVPVIESGDVVELTTGAIGVVDRIHVGQVFIDATLDRVDRDLLRDRRRSAADGIVVVVVAVDRDGGAVDGYPEFITRGFVPGAEDADDDILDRSRRVVIDALRDASPEERADESMLVNRIQVHLTRFLRRQAQRQPLIIPVIVEL